MAEDDTVCRGDCEDLQKRQKYMDILKTGNDDNVSRVSLNSTQVSLYRKSAQV